MLKRILVPLDTTAFTLAATRVAAYISEKIRADTGEAVSLVGLGIMDMDQVPTGRFASLVPRDRLIEEAQEKVTELLEAFRTQVRSLGVPESQVEIIRVSGSPFRELIHESVFCDLIVMGEKCSYPPVNQDYDTMHELYHHVSRPMILADQRFDHVDTVVMAMDGTAPSSRMMYQYVQLNPFPGARVVLTYSREEESEYNLHGFFTRVETYLQSHRIEVRTRPFEGDAEEELVRVSNEDGAGMLAFGSHRETFMSRMSDPLQIRGSFARRIQRRSPASLFIVH